MEEDLISKALLPIKIEVDQDIYLKQLEVEESEVLFKLVDANRENLRVWLPWVDKTKGVEDSENFIRGALENFANSGNFEMGIWYKKQLVGCIGIHELNVKNRKTAIGYWLAEEFRGEGIMTRANKGLISYLFEKLNLHRVEIRCGVENEKSCAIPKRLGFKLEGVSREAEWIGEKVVSHNVFSILENEW